MNKIIQTQFSKISNNEKIIHDFINNDTSKFIDFSIKEIADYLFLSIGSITRYAKKMGFSGFKDLKNFVIRENERQKKYHQTDSNFLEDVNIFYLHSIEKTMGALTPKILNEATDKLKESKKIVCYGIGSSFNVAQEMALNLQIIGKEAFLAKTIHDIVLFVQNYKNKECTICFFSKSVQSKENKFILDLLNKYGFHVILITNNRKFVTNEKITVIHFYTLEQEKRVIALSSKVSQLFIADILLRKLYLSLEKKKRDIYNEFNKNWQ